MTLIAVGVLLSPSNARGTTFQTVGPIPYGDDLHSATLNPYPPTPVTNCDWINIGLNAFIAANPANGSGPSGEGWTYHWADQAQELKVLAGIKILDYYPWVVTPPQITAAPGSKPTPGNPNGAKVFQQGAPAEQGGAVINLQYTPQPGAPKINNLHWIQAGEGTIYGEASPPHLDNNPLNLFAQSDETPFYGGPPGPFAAGTLAGGGGWFADRPFNPENEYESNPVASMQYQVILASDDITRDKNGVFQNDITLYGGVWWGYTYVAVDSPEPGSLTLLGSGALGLLGYGWRRWIHWILRFTLPRTKRIHRRIGHPGALADLSLAGIICPLSKPEPS
jgi:hypothetical protein